MNAILNPNISIASTDINLLDGLYSLNDLHKASGNASKHKPTFFLRNEQTKELITELQKSNSTDEIMKIKRGGTIQGTWVCKELVYAYAMWISPKFHLMVIRTFDDVVAKKYGNNDHPSTVADRNGLIKTVHMTMKRLDLGFSEAFNLVLHRFNVAHVGDLTQSQVGEATEYLHRLMFAGSVDKFRQSDYEQVALSETDETDVVIEHGTPTTMVNQTMASGKFVGTIDHNGRMAMRELDAEEVIITVDMLPHLIDNRKININVLSRIVLSASHQLYTATYTQRPQQAVALAQGGHHDSI